ncbi:MAG: hypothetical protein LBS20_11505 [Prevotella sp.]|jgi:hypothetical protein|nr:hypothetical protein [Prevotella sp.]
MENKTGSLHFTVEEGDTCEIFLDPVKHPQAYSRKLHELIHLTGMTEDEAKEYIATIPIVMELAYDTDRGLFMVEAETVENSEIYNPYTGIIVPNDNLPEADENPIKFLDSSIGMLQNMSGDLRTEVYDKHDFSCEHMGCIEEAIELIDEAVDKLNDIDLTEEREKWQSSHSNTD